MFFGKLPDEKLIPAEWDTPAPPVYASLPSSWKSEAINGKQGPIFGRATYHLTMIVDTARVKTLEIACKEQCSAYTLWIDGRAVISNGHIGASKCSHGKWDGSIHNQQN